MTLTVLIVDDSKLARMAVIKALNTLYPAWERLEAGSAMEAVEIARHVTADIALIDFNMPEKDGLTLIAELRELHPEVSVAMISANRQAEVIGRAREAGAAFLVKPLKERDLKGFLDAVLEQRKSAGSGGDRSQA